jgi:signal transduction histidine kinase
VSLLPGATLCYNDCVSEEHLEPGFLRVFRVFVSTQIVFWVLIGPILVLVEMTRGGSSTLDQVMSMTLVERLTLPNVAPLISMELVLLALALIPQVPRMLGRWFLPLILLGGLLPQLVGYYWWPSYNPLQTPFVIFFVVMLVLIAWQYSFHHVAAYVLGLTFFQIWFKEPTQQVPRSVDVGWLALQGVMMLLVGYVIVQLVARQREQRAALAEAVKQQAAANARLHRYADAIEELTISRERNRLARELHDTLAHSLSAVTVQLEAVRALWQVDPSAARHQLETADAAARQGLTEARRSLQALRASPLEDLGLLLALKDLARTAAERTGAELTLELPECLEADLVPAIEQGVYRIAQETLENVVRHAEPSTITFRLSDDATELTVHIEDDGRGFQRSADSTVGTRTAGQLGLRGMRERAALIGGRLSVESQPGRGTKVTLTVPLADPGAARRSGPAG